MPTALDRSRDPQYLYLYKKCLESYRTVLYNNAQHKYSDCLWNKYEVLEFFWKAVSFLQSGRYLKKHLPENMDFQNTSNFLTAYLNPTELRKIKSIYRRSNPNWWRNPPQRMQTRYGDERTNIPPSRLYSPIRANQSVKDCTTIAKELVNINRILLRSQPNYLIGILNGKFSRSQNEIPCDGQNYATNTSPKQWQRFVSNITNAKGTLKTVSALNNSLCAVINPFGESYPERPSTIDVLPAYDMIRDYVFFGGVFITCGGMPFTYYFDVISGNHRSLSTVVPNYPFSIQQINVGGLPQVRVRSTTLLVNNLITKDFQIMVAMDDPTAGRVGPINTQINQNTNDRTYWNCNKIGNWYHVFRPIDPSRSPNAVPIIRGQLGTQNVYPIAFVKFGFGILLHMGLDLSTGRNSEFRLAKDAVRGFIQNFTNYF